jgi:ribosomal-protein-alanine N-acetyltransferase
LLIRTWEKEDNKSIADLEQVCFAFPWTYEMVAETQAQSTFLGSVAEIEGEVVGYAGAIFCFNQADIALVAVKPEYRRQGIAQKLINQLIDWLLQKNVNEVFLEVRVSNTPARELYKRMDFNEVGIRKKYYEDAEDAIVMLKVI